MAGGGGGSSSSSNKTTNTDQRLAVGDGGAGISGDNSAITINSVDGAIVSRALDSVDTANAAAGAGFTELLSFGERLIGTTQKSVADAYLVANTDGKGTIDNKTLIALVAVGGVAFSVWAYARGKK